MLKNRTNLDFMHYICNRKIRNTTLKKYNYETCIIHFGYVFVDHRKFWS